MKDTVPSDQIYAKLYVAQILHIKDPVHKVKLVLEMIVETFAVHIALLNGVDSINSFNADASTRFVILESATIVPPSYISVANNAAPRAPQSCDLSLITSFVHILSSNVLTRP